jgi:hypothetical protein
MDVSRSRHKQQHFQYPLALIPTTLLHLNNGVGLHEFDELWVKTFITRKPPGKTDPFWLTISKCDFI